MLINSNHMVFKLCVCVLHSALHVYFMLCVHAATVWYGVHVKVRGQPLVVVITFHPILRPPLPTSSLEHWDRRWALLHLLWCAFRESKLKLPGLCCKQFCPTEPSPPHPGVVLTRHKLIFLSHIKVLGCELTKTNMWLSIAYGTPPPCL